MIKNIKFLGCCFLIFATGFNVAINLIKLLPVNPSFEAEWWKVCLSVFFFLFFSIMAKESA